MIVKEGKEVHPLRQSKIMLGGDTIYERNIPRQRTWFILDLALPSKTFVPAGSGPLVTADGLTFGEKSRRN